MTPHQFSNLCTKYRDFKLYNAISGPRKHNFQKLQKLSNCSQNVFQTISRVFNFPLEIEKSLNLKKNKKKKQKNVMLYMIYQLQMYCAPQYTNFCVCAPPEMETFHFSQSHLQSGTLFHNFYLFQHRKVSYYSICRFLKNARENTRVQIKQDYKSHLSA